MLTTIARVKGTMSMTLPEKADALLTRLILEVTGVVEDYCNRYFHFAEFTEIKNGTGKTMLRLRGLPVWEVVSVTIDDEEIDPEDYTIDYRLGEIYYESGFTEGFQNVEVVYKAGYDYPEEPEEGEEEEELEYEYTTPAELEGAIIAEVVSRYENYTTETRMGENLVDLRTNFLTSRARDYFSRQRIPNV